MNFKEFSERADLYEPMINAVYVEGVRYFNFLFRYWDDKACGMTLNEFLKKFEAWNDYEALQWVRSMDWTKYPEFACPSVSTEKIIEALYNSNDPVIVEFAEKLDMAYSRGLRAGFVYEANFWKSKLEYQYNREKEEAKLKI